MTRAQRLALTLGLVLALVAAPASAAKPDKSDRNADGKPGWGMPSHAPAHGARQLIEGCHFLGCPNPTPPEPEPDPDPEPVPEPIPEPPITCATGPCLPPVIDLPDTALQ